MKKWNKGKVLRLVGIGVLVCIMFCSVLILNFYNVINPISGVSALPVCSVDSEQKQVALTFDCVSFGKETRQIMNILDEFGVEATFFVPGEKAAKNESLLSDLWSKGHDIGNMTHTYRNLGDVKTNVIKNEIQECNNVIRKITKEDSVLFRAPYDDYGDNVVKTAAAMGMYSIRYDVDALTWKPELTAEKAVHSVMENVKPGSIIVFNADGRFVLDTLREILTGLKMQQYQPVRVTDMLFEDPFTVDVNGMQMQPHS